MVNKLQWMMHDVDDWRFKLTEVIQRMFTRMFIDHFLK